MTTPNRRMRTPAYCLHKGKGLAYCTIDGRQVYLGVYDSPQSRIEYQRVIGEWRARVAAEAPVPESGLVADIMLRWLDYCETEYAASTVASVRTVLTYLRGTPGRSGIEMMAAADLTPQVLRGWRAGLVEQGLARTHVNEQMRRLRWMLKWAWGEGLCSSEALEAARAISPLRAGRPGMREPAGVRPVHDDVIRRTLPHLTPVLADMVMLQRHTGMRPAEVVAMRGADLDTSGAIWVYAPRQHKTAHLGRSKAIYIGPRGQEILKRHLVADLALPLFRYDERSGYTRSAYARAVNRAIALAIKAGDLVKDERWAPRQLRKSMATQVRKEAGLEAAQVLLGHARADVTQLYAERDGTRAREVIARIG